LIYVEASVLGIWSLVALKMGKYNLCGFPFGAGGLDGIGNARPLLFDIVNQNSAPAMEEKPRVISTQAPIYKSPPDLILI
jgi:hypothetical protein